MKKDERRRRKMQTVMAWRRAKEISQEEMADRLKIHVNTYQNWESEPDKISIGNAKKIAEIFGVSLDEILFEKQEGVRA
jgi:transcriptional regulator with XRE-family HTH domain